MIAAILAAGRGKRMQPLTETRLKGSLPIHNQPVLLRLAEMLFSSGFVEQLVLVISPWQEKAMRALFEGTPFVNNLQFTIQDPPLGTGDAVAKVKPFVPRGADFLVINGDINTALPALIPRMLAQQEKLGAKCTLAVFPGRGARYGLLQLGRDGRVLNIKEKQQPGELPESNCYINAGVYLFNSTVFDMIQKIDLSDRGEYELTDAINLLGKQAPIGAVIIDKWMSIENPLDLFRAQTYFEPNEQLKCLQFHSGGEIGFKATENLFFDADTTVEFSSVQIQGPVLIGKDTLVESGTQLGPFVFLGEGCEIGAQCSLQNVLLLERGRIEAGCDLTNLIAGEDVLIGKETKVNPPLREPLQLEDFILLGGRCILGSHMKLTKGQKIHAHTVLRRGSQEQNKISTDKHPLWRIKKK